MKASDAVKKALKSKGITQNGLADRMGTGQSSVAMYLSRETSMKVENLMRMANACGYDVVLVDRENAKNAYVIGENDEVNLGSGDESFDERVREIIADELAKREVGTPGEGK